MSPLLARRCLSPRNVESRKLTSHTYYFNSKDLAVDLVKASAHPIGAWIVGYTLVPPKMAKGASRLIAILSSQEFA